jgi:chromosome segregation ATPase
MGCHQNMASPEFWTDGVVKKYGRVASTNEHIDVMNQVIVDAVTAEGTVEMPTGVSKEDLAAAKQKAADAEAALQEAEQAKADAEEAATTAQAELDATQEEILAAKTDAAAAEAALEMCDLLARLSPA